MKKNYLLLTVLFFCAASMAFAQIDLNFGTGAGQVGYFNQNNHPGVEEPFPVGPLAFRLCGEDVWVADSIGGKLIKHNKASGFVSELSLVASPAQILIEDFALVKDANGNLSSFWLIEAISNKLVNFSVTGIRSGEIANASFVQPFRVEVGPGGNIFVGDKGAQTIFVFDPAGKMISQANWEWSGFAVSGAEDSLHRVFFATEDSRSYLVTQNLAGDITREVELVLPEHINPELWWVDEEKQEAVLTYTPATGFTGTFVLVRVGFNGEVLGTCDFKPPFVMNRFIDQENGTAWVGTADYARAPEGCLTLSPFNMP